MKKFFLLILLFSPDIHIMQQLPQDLELLAGMKKLFFETDDSKDKQRDVYNKAVNNFGAQEIMLLTQDNFRISTLFWKRPDAPVNIIYVMGYFHDQTPTKEWAAPFTAIFPEFNILTFDWRGFGYSEGKHGKWISNDFGFSATHDIQAAVDFFRKENSKPIVLVGFCAGAAMALQTTFQSQQTGKQIVDALVLDSIFTKFENQFNRAFLAEKKWFMKFLVKIGIKLGIGKIFIDYLLDGSLFQLNPIEIIDQISIPCCFFHFKNDPFAIISEGIEVFQKAKCFRMFVLANIGWHVRMHTKTPHQYRNAFLEFLTKSGLINSTFSVKNYNNQEQPCNLGLRL